MNTATIGRLGLLTAMVALVTAAARADRFILRGSEGKRIELEARVAGSGEGVGVLEQADGQYRLVPAAAVEKRERAEGPEPLTADQAAAALTKQFGAERFRSVTAEPYLMGLVLSAPLPRGSEARATNLLQQVASFMNNVDAAFARFVKEARIPAKPPRFPLVVLIFESRADFEKYLAPSLEGTEISGKRVGGFYSKLTNFLALRLEECRTYDVMLHEAIHQQVYNRNVLARLAPVPAWFDEGLATGFEANQGKISVGPGKISLRYAGQALDGSEVPWEQMITDDALFASADLVSQAYGNAWGLHWLLVTRYKAQYGEYLRRLAQKKPLAKDTPESRLAEFRDAIGKDPALLQKEFIPALQAAMKRQKLTRPVEEQPGYAIRSDNQGEVKIFVVQVHARAGMAEAAKIDTHGTLTNLSPLRPLSFRVTMQHGSGASAQWLIPNLGILKSLPLKPQTIPLGMQLNPGGLMAGARANTYSVRIESAAPDSPEAQRWQSGGTSPTGVIPR